MEEERVFFIAFAGGFAWFDIVEKPPRVKPRDSLGREGGNEKRFPTYV